MIDFAESKVVDTHIHRPASGGLSEKMGNWNRSYVDFLYPGPDSSSKRDFSKMYEKQTLSHIRYRGLLRYISKVYGCKPRLSDADEVILKQSKEKGLTKYIEEVLNREKIKFVILDHSKLVTRPVPNLGDFPRSRAKWTYPIIHLLQPAWSIDKGHESIDEITDSLDKELKECVRKGFCGLKSVIAYYRTLSIENVDWREADRAYKKLRKKKPKFKSFIFPGEIPYYEEPTYSRYLRQYEDFILKYIFMKAGSLGLKVFIHSSAATNPILRPELINPVKLYSVIDDEDIRRSRATFVVIHAGFPYYRELSIMITQFPNVYADLSMQSQFPGNLQDILKTFLQIAPPEKIMHGSDAGEIVEVMGYSANNTKKALAITLNEFKARQDWTERECIDAGEMILHGSAEKLFAS